MDEEGNKPVTAATLGYTPEEVMPPWEVKQARHNMQISEAEDEVKIAHELGHGKSKCCPCMILSHDDCTN